MFFSPLLYAIFWPLCALLIVTRLKLNMRQKKDFFSFLTYLIGLLFFLILTIFLLLLFLFLSQLIFDFSQIQQINVYSVFFGMSFEQNIFSPFREEIAKLLPLFVFGYISQRTVRTQSLDLDEDIDLLKLFGYKTINLHSKIDCIFFGITSGTVFTALEIIFYNSFPITKEETIFNLIVRLGVPIHILTTTLASIGIYSFVNAFDANQKKSKITIIRLLLGKFFPYFFLAWIIHGLWNSGVSIIFVCLTGMFNTFLGLNLKPFLIYAVIWSIFSICSLLVILLKSGKFELELKLDN